MSSATVESPIVRTKRPGALIWFLRKSRDQWKSKVQQIRTELKRLQNRVADVTKSRESWKQQAQAVGERESAMQAEVARLQERVAELEREKKTRGRPANR